METLQETAGIWWLPDAPDRCVPGLVSFSINDGFRLRLPLENLAEGTAPDAGPFHADRCIHGRLQNGKKVTLASPDRVASYVGVPGEEYMCDVGFLGKVNCSADPQIDLARISYTNLREWAAEHPLDVTFHEDRAGSLGRVEYEYEGLPARKLAAGGEWSIEICHTTTLPVPSPAGANIRHDCYLEITFDPPRGLSDADDQLHGPLWQFVSFAIDKPVACKSLKVREAQTGAWLEVRRAQSEIREERATPLAAMMLLPLPSCLDRQPRLLETWLHFRGDLRRAASLLFGLGREELLIDLRFLAAVQAFEAMARSIADEFELEQEEFARRLSVVERALGDDNRIRRWAKRKLQHANRKSADHLARELLRFVGIYATKLVPSADRFLKQIRENRNFYTHRDSRGKEVVLEGIPHHLLTEAVICLLKASLVRHLGFGPEETAAILADCPKVQQTTRRVAAEYL